MKDEELSKDPDATWLKKGNKNYFGYKGFVTTDVEDGYIETVHVTPAHVSEMTEFKNNIPKIHLGESRLFADKGSGSKDYRDLLKKYAVFWGHYALRF